LTSLDAVNYVSDSILALGHAMNRKKTVCGLLILLLGLLSLVGCKESADIDIALDYEHEDVKLDLSIEAPELSLDLEIIPPGPRPQISHGMNGMYTQIDAPIKNSPGNRNPSSYLAIIDQFDVENSYPARYRPNPSSSNSGDADTRCNIFAGDVMRAMGVPLPTKGELGVGHGNSRYTDPMTANARDLYNWLSSGSSGWRKIDINNPADLELLRNHLRAGKPALASDPGHIAVLRPDQLPGQLTIANLGDIRIAQAGAYNYNDIALQDAGYGTAFQPDFYIHD
jgi:hypothetical protein